MKLAKVITVVTNKYFIAAAFFVVWMLFFDQRDLFQQRERQAELKKLEMKKKYYQEEINKTKEELNNIHHNPASLEKLARERYQMKKEGEDIYLIEDSAATR